VIVRNALEKILRISEEKIRTHYAPEHVVVGCTLSSLPFSYAGRNGELRAEKW
jgi:hypothetical protein